MSETAGKQRKTGAKRGAAGRGKGRSGRSAAVIVKVETPFIVGGLKFDDMTARVGNELLPSLVAFAVQYYGGNRVKATLAVLDSWRAMAGISGWTDAMVDEVDARVAEAVSGR